MGRGKRAKNGAEGAVFEIFFGFLEKFVNKNAIKSDFSEKSGLKIFSRNFSENFRKFLEFFRKILEFFRKILEFSKIFGIFEKFLNKNAIKSKI